MKWRSLKAVVSRLIINRRGQFSTIVAILAPVALGLAGGAVDFLLYMNHRSELQSAADAAVLAAAKESSLKGWNEKYANEIAKAIIDSAIKEKTNASHSFELVIDAKSRRMDIRVYQDHYAYFVAGYFSGSPQIDVRSAAIVSGQSTLCIIVQSQSQKDSLVAHGNSRVKAQGCAAYSNSIDPKSVNVKDVSILSTLMTCTAGGYIGKLINYRPLPLTDCPLIADPLQERARLIDAGLPKSCDHKKLKIEGGNRTLSPGVYCGDVEITDGATVKIEPSIYVFRNKKLKVEKGAKLFGTDVGLVFVGQSAELELKNDSTIALAAPRSGPMSGILIYGQPTGKSRKFSIVSADAQKLTGTVYLPNDALTVGGDDDLDGVCDPILPGVGRVETLDSLCESDVGSTSDWTAIIVRQLKVTAGSSLTINSDYKNSNVPVPDGIGPNSSNVILAR